MSLAQAASAPKAIALYTTSTADTAKSVSLIAGTGLTATCGPSATGQHEEAALRIGHSGATQIDGTSFVSQTGSADVFFQRLDGGTNTTSPGAQQVIVNTSGTFIASSTIGVNEYATLNAHLIVTVAGAVYTINAVVDVNTDAPYCRVSAEVEQVAT